LSRDDRVAARSRGGRGRRSDHIRHYRDIDHTGPMLRRAVQAPGLPQRKLKTSVCAGSSFFLFLLSNPSGATSTRVPDVVAECLASAVPMRKLRKNRAVLRMGTRKRAVVT